MVLDTARPSSRQARADSRAPPAARPNASPANRPADEAPATPVATWVTAVATLWPIRAVAIPLKSRSRTAQPVSARYRPPAASAAANSHQYGASASALNRPRICGPATSRRKRGERRERDGRENTDDDEVPCDLVSLRQWNRPVVGEADDREYHEEQCRRGGEGAELARVVQAAEDRVADRRNGICERVASGDDRDGAPEVSSKRAPQAARGALDRQSGAGAPTPMDHLDGGVAEVRRAPRASRLRKASRALSFPSLLSRATTASRGTRRPGRTPPKRGSPGGSLPRCPRCFGAAA